MELKKRLNRISIRQYMILYFILAMILTQAAIGFWVYFSWVESARDTTQKISRSMNDSIYQQIDALVEEPMQLLRSHQQSISSGTLQLGDASQRDPYFVYALNAGEFIVDAGPFDPRTRPWYQAAKKEGKPVF